MGGTGSRSRWPLFFVLAAVAYSTLGSAAPPVPAPALAVTDVTVVDVTRGRLLAAQTVVVVGNRIQTVGPTGTVRLPAGAKVVDARGKYLIPGLWDMHVHLDDNADELYPRFIAHGVTGVREMAQRGNYRGKDFRDLQADVMDGAVVGPRSLGPSADPNFPTAEDARRIIDSLKAAGDPFVKVHPGTNDPQIFFAMLREARRVGLPVVGHSQTVTRVQASDSGMHSMEHVETTWCWDSSHDSSSIGVGQCPEVAKAYIRNGTWIDPTLAIYHYHGYDLIPNQKEVRKLHRLGVRRFLAGTDYINLGMKGFHPGLSLLEELVFLVGAGLTPLEALQAGTLHPAMSFNATDSLGTVEPGKLADLVLLDANPLADIRNVMTTRAVVANGRYFDSTALNGLDPEGIRQKHVEMEIDRQLSVRRPPAPPLKTIVFRGVTVVDVTDGKLLGDQTVVVAGHRVQAAGAAGRVRVPAGAQVVDARGKYLIPGLWDMHVHMGDLDHYRYVARQDSVYHALYPRFIAHGVTGIREMAQRFRNGADSFKVWQRAVAAGTRVGPRAVGPSTDLTYDGATHSFKNYGVNITSAEDARRVMDSLRAAGAAFVKFRDDDIKPELYFAILREARRVGLPLVGHVPTAVSNVAAADSGQRDIEHVEEHHQCWPDWPARLDSAAAASRCAPVAQAYIRDGTWLAPTLVRANYVDGNASDAAQFVRMLRRSGVEKFLSGTDISLEAMGRAPKFRPGFSAVEEVVALAGAGFTPLEALQAATLNPAKFFDATDSLGTVAQGKLADLVLLDADPLADISALMKVRAVVANGRYFDRVALDRLDPGVKPAAGYGSGGARRAVPARLPRAGRRSS